MAAPTFAYVPGLAVFVQNALLTCCAGVLANTIAPITDPVGMPVSVPMVADFPDVLVEEGPQAIGERPLDAPFVHVGAQLGQIQMANDYGRVGTTADGAYHVMQAYIPETQGIFTVYARQDAERRHLADWLAWGIMSAYGINLDTGERIDSYVLRSLRDWGLQPLLRRLFERPEYPPPELSEPRPAGLPYRAVLRLNLDVQVAWTTQPYTPALTAILTPEGTTTGTVAPIEIHLPFVLAPPTP